MDARLKAAEMVMADGKTHMVRWGRFAGMGYMVTVYKLPDLSSSEFTGWAGCKYFRTLRRDKTINWASFKRIVQSSERAA